MRRCRIEDPVDPSCRRGADPFIPAGGLIGRGTKGTHTHISTFLENAPVILMFDYQLVDRPADKLGPKYHSDARRTAI